VRPLIVLAGLSYVLQGGAAAPPSVQLPPIALDAATAGVVPLAYVLARAKVPAGIVTADNPSDFAFARAATGLDVAPSVPIADVVARFTSRFPQYRVTWRDAVLSIAAEDSPCLDAVQKSTAGRLGAMSMDASRVLVFLTQAIRGQLGQGPPRGTTGSILGNMSDLAQKLPAISYTLENEMPIAEAFDRVVRNNKGGVWFAWQHTRSDGKLGCRSVAYWPNGLVSAPDEDFYIAVK
jgi:hypothetical protein